MIFHSKFAGDMLAGINAMNQTLFNSLLSSAEPMIVNPLLNFNQISSLDKIDANKKWDILATHHWYFKISAEGALHLKAMGVQKTVFSCFDSGTSNVLLNRDTKCTKTCNKGNVDQSLSHIFCGDGHDGDDHVHDGDGGHGDDHVHDGDRGHGDDHVHDHDDDGDHDGGDAHDGDGRGGHDGALLHQVYQRHNRR
ncbi:hypothetical protein AVEN_144381-1 [Araneus ventricosus]|uniref:Uncharacterized protein n=1 Tax=Araneus ventricosus TaxID=182803 RepID=A0A4Y2E652_ARAVE|nr:hypothetical protein AVEN_144381-1 [Araneus ventricosus]